MRVYNFSPGPSMMPLPVLERAAREMTDYNGTGMSVMEMSHRGKPFMQIMENTQNLMRELMHIPDDYYVLFMQGGASMQFAAIPLNLMTTGAATYIDSGNFAHNALVEGERYGRVDVLASSREDTYRYIPEFDVDRIAEDSSYLYITTNNTIFGTRYIDLPKPKNVPLVADMSSNILSQPYDVRDFGLIYAGVQKNLGPAGMAVVIVRKDLVGKAGENVPKMLNFQTYADNNSMFNTPPVVPIYSLMETMRWVKANGGVAEMDRRARERAEVLYAEIDRNKLFRGTVAEEDRSVMNICFVMNEEYKELEKPFLDFAVGRGMVGIKGHRSVGGFRASCYNAQTMEGVQALVQAMKDFENQL